MTSSISQDAAMASSQGTIRGTIEFQDVREVAPDAKVYVRVQETGRADAPATTVSEQVFPAVNIAPGMEAIPFEVHGIRLDPQGRYSVRVHADVNHSGAVTKGDYVSMQSYPVESGADSNPINIVARPVR
jgi:uncharacterized lipoprotein YbaY